MKKAVLYIITHIYLKWTMYIRESFVRSLFGRDNNDASKGPLSIGSELRFRLRRSTNHKKLT